MKGKIAAAVVIVVAVFGTLVGIKVLQIRTLIAAGKAFVQPPESVSSAVAHEEKWQDTLDAVGSVTAIQGVTITPEIDGTVVEIGVESGAVVAKDDLLVRLDTSNEEAQLRSLEAQSDLDAHQCRTRAHPAGQQHHFPVRTGPGGGHFETGAGRGRRDARDHRQEDAAGALRRQAGHPPGEPGGIHPKGPGRDPPAIAGPGVRRISRCRNKIWPTSRPA